MLRSFVEKITRYFSFQRRLPAALGGAHIYVSPSAGLRYLFHSMETIDPILHALAKEFVRPDHIVWDVGANIGLFTFAAAHLAGPRGRVISFEPDAWLVQLLRRSSAKQPATSAPVQIIPAAVADTCALRTFNLSSRSRSMNFLSGHGLIRTEKIAEQQTVVSVNLDWVAEQAPLPDILKIDVEGAEVEVLRGANSILEEKHPVILCETGSEHAPQVTALLRDKGYHIYDGSVPSKQRKKLGSAPWSTVAIAG